MPGPQSGFDWGVVKWAVSRLIEGLGEDPDRDGLKDTPQRVASAYNELLGGYGIDLKTVFKEFDNDGNYDQMVVVRDIDFVSLCEHHMLPFEGVAHVGYLPQDTIVGLSKLARLVNVFAARLQVQERLTNQITDAIQEHLHPKGCGCVIEARHLCMACRGVKKQNSIMVTSALNGAFRDDSATRAEFLQFIRSR